MSAWAHLCRSIEGLHNAVRTYAHCGNISVLPLAQHGMEKNNKKCWNFLFTPRIRIAIFTECVVIFLPLGCNLVMWYELNKKIIEYFVTFPNTVPCKQETNMVVASMMTCKI